MGPAFCSWFCLVKEDELASFPEKFMQQDRDKAQEVLVDSSYGADELAQYCRRLYSEYI